MPRPDLGSWDAMNVEEKLEALRRHVAQRLITHVKFVRVHGYAQQPFQAYKGDAGWDLALCEEAILKPGEQRDLKTGVIAAIPEGYWGHILARSGVIRKMPVVIQEAVIDSSYRGELYFLVRNVGAEPVAFAIGDRLAQIIITPLPPRVEWLEQTSLPDGERGLRGFGSSGLGQGVFNLGEMHDDLRDGVRRAGSDQGEAP